MMSLAELAAKAGVGVGAQAAKLGELENKMKVLAAAGGVASTSYAEQARAAQSLTAELARHATQLGNAYAASVRRAAGLREELAAEVAEAGGAAKLRQEKELLVRAMAAGYDPASRLGQAYLANLRTEIDLAATTSKLVQENEQLAASERTLHASVAATTAELNQENGSMARVLSAFAKGPGAVARQRQEEEILNRIKASGVKLGGEQAVALERELRERQRLTAAIEKQEAANRGQVRASAGGGGGGGVGALVGGLAAYVSVGSIIHGIVEEVGEGEKAFAQLAAGVKSTGGAAGYTATQLVDMAEGFSSLTGIDDEVIQGAESLLLTFTKIGHDVFPQAQQAVLDLSTRLDGDLKTSAIQVGKALNDPIAGITALKKVGISFSEEQKRTIKAFVETGQIAKAQGIILQELAVEVGGSAAAFRNTLPGALSALKVSWGNLLQDLGNGDIGKLIRSMVERAIKALDSPEIRVKGQQIAADLVGVVVKGLNAVVATLKVVSDHWDLLRAALIAYVAVRVGAVLFDTAKLLVDLARGAALAERSILGLNAAWLLSPWGLITVGIAAAAAGIYVYTSRLNASHAAELNRLDVSAQAKVTLDDLRGRTEKLTDAEWDRVEAIKATIEAEAKRADLDARKAVREYSAQRGRAGQGAVDVFDAFVGDKIADAVGVQKGGRLERLQQEMEDAQGRSREYQKTLIDLNKETIRLGHVSGTAANDVRNLTDEQTKAGESLAKHIADLQAAEAAAQRLASAAVRGPDNFREQQGKEAILNDLLQQQEALRKVGLSLTQEQVAAITGAISGQRAANDSAQAYLVLWQEIQSTKDNAITQEARLQDAVSGTTDASQRAAANIEAESKARANGYAGNKPYVDLLAQEALTRSQLNQQIEATIKGIERNREVANEFATLEAQIVDARTQGVAASKAEAIQQQAVAIAIERGTLSRRGEVAAIRQSLEQQEAERTLKRGQLADLQAELALRDRLANARAEVLDFQAGQAAVREYGSEIAGILQNYGLIGDAVNKLARDQEALNRLHAEGLDESTREGLLRLFHWQGVVDSEHEALKGVKLYGAQIEIASKLAADLQAPWLELGATIESSIEGNLIKAATGSKAAWKDMWQSFLEDGVKAALEWLKVWLRNIAIAKAAEKSDYGAALNFKPQSSGSGGATQAAGGAGGGGGGYLSGWWNGSSGSSAGAGYAAGFAVVAAILIHWLDTKGTSWARTDIKFGGSQGIGIGSGANDQQGATPGNNKKNIAQVLAGAVGIIKVVRDFVVSLGGEIDLTQASLGQMSLKKVGQGKKTHWIVTTIEGIVKDFGRDMEAALQYGAIQAIKATPTTGLSPEVKQAIKASVAETLDAFNKDIATALAVVHSRLGEAGSQVYDTFRGSEEQIAAARALGLATDDLVAARDREVEATRNQILGVDDSTAKYLASLASFNAGIAEATVGLQERLQRDIASTQARLDAMGTGPSSATQPELPNGRPRPPQTQEMWDRERERLQTELGRYLVELDKLPRALSDTEINMGIFDSLYKYLEGSAKYAKQAKEFAQLKVELEFAAIKAQLIALDKWSQFEGMFNDAYNAARNAAGRGAGGRGGSGRQEARAGALEHLDELRNAGASDAIRIYRESIKSLADWRKEAKEAHLTQAQLAEGERLISEQRKKDIRSQAESLAGIGTDFTRQLHDGLKFFADLKNLGRKETGIPDWLRVVMEGKFLDGMKQSFAQALNQFNGFTDPFLAISTQAGVLRENLKALADAGKLTADEVAEATRRIAEGEQFQRQQAINGIFEKIYGYLKDTPEYAGQILEFKKKELDLEFLILEAQLKAVGLWTPENEKLVNDAHKAGAKILEDGAKEAAKILVGAARASAIQADRNMVAGYDILQAQKDAAVAFTDLVRNLVDSNRRILTGAQSPLGPQERFQAALADYQRTLTAAQGGNSEALGALPGIRDALLSVAQQYFAGGAGEGLSGGFAQLVQQTLADFANLAVSPAVEAATLQDLVRRQTTAATDAAAQAHADLISLRQAVVDLNANNGVGNLYGGSNRFASAPAAPVDRFSAGAPVAPVVPFPVRGGGDGDSALAAEIAKLRVQVANLEKLALRTANATEGTEENTETIAEDAEDAKRARARAR
jgi:hypothetical protein